MTSFDFNRFTVEEFESHIQKSIPNYDGLFDLTKSLVERYQQPFTTVVDIGASTGKLHRLLSKDDTIEYVSVDKANIGGYIPDSNCDINSYFSESDANNTSVITSLFCLQFLRPDDRAEALTGISNKLTDNGVFICAEKTYFDDVETERVVHDLYIEKKRLEFSDKDVLNKQHQLNFSMYPVTETKLYDELSAIGKPVLIWKSYNFIAYMVKKS